MSGTLSNYGEEQMARFLFTALAVARPANHYMALHKYSPGENCTQEASYSGYGRKAINFSAPSGAKVANSNAIKFAEPPPGYHEPGSSFGGTFQLPSTYKFWSIWGAPSAGNPLGWADFATQFNPVKTLGIGSVQAHARYCTPFAAALGLNWLFRSPVAVVRPSAWFMSLHYKPPSASGFGGEIVDLGIGFARQPITFIDPTNGVLSNPALVTFGPASEAWPSFINWSVWDAAVAGNCLFTKPFPTPLAPVNAGGSIKFPVGTVKISVG